jgi:hypothetical protein
MITATDAEIIDGESGGFYRNVDWWFLAPILK